MINKNLTNSKSTPEDITECLMTLFSTIHNFRKRYGVDSEVDNPYESFTGMTDKNSRIGRQIKHFFRDDPKEDWPRGVGGGLMGYVIYFFLLMERIVKEETKSDPDNTQLKEYKFWKEMLAGAEDELESMIKQYTVIGEPRD